MRFLSKVKDGGPNSPVDAYFLIEWKGLFSIALLKFNKGERQEYHNHAFNALTWLLKGRMGEKILLTNTTWKARNYKRSLIPKLTRRGTMHRVIASENSWCLTIRGPWHKCWQEYHNGVTTTLTHGREVVSEKFDTNEKGSKEKTL